MNAEIVRADQIKAGDRIHVFGRSIEVVGVSSVTGTVHLDVSEGTQLHYSPHSEIPRILPDPIEESDCWRINYEEEIVVPEGTRWIRRIGIVRPTKESAIEAFRLRYADRMDRVKNATVENSRTTILSREEVNP